jgi:hypothetical protein
MVTISLPQKRSDKPVRSPQPGRVFPDFPHIRRFRAVFEIIMSAVRLDLEDRVREAWRSIAIRDGVEVSDLIGYAISDKYSPSPEQLVGAFRN